MRVFLVSDHAPVTTEVRNILHREGLSCPIGAHLPLDLALAGIPGPRPDLLVVRQQGVRIAGGRSLARREQSLLEGGDVIERLPGGLGGRVMGHAQNLSYI